MAIENRIIKKFGEEYVEIRYKGEKWHNWLFPLSKTKKDNYVYIPELNVYRRNTSI